MKIQTDTKLIDLSGKVLDGVTVGSVISNCLAGQKSDNPAMSYQLAKKFSLENVVDLKIEELAFVKKKLTESTYTDLVVGQIIELLES